MTRMMEEIKKAQRSKNSNVSIIDYFRFYRKTVPGKDVKRSTYYAIIKECNQLLVDDLVAGRTILLPFLGSVRIEKFAAAPQYKGIDYNHFNQTGEKIKRYRPHLLECFAPKLSWQRGLIAHPYCKDFTFKTVRDTWRNRVLSQFKIEGGHRKFIEYI